MATTISGPTVTDDSGTPASPVGDGTLFDAAFFSSLYAAINAMWSGATHVFAGILTVNGFGTHLFQAGGSGGHALRIRNTTSGSGNFAQLEVGNDTGSIGTLIAWSSTHTETGDIKQDGVSLRNSAAGGVSVAATHASGDVRLYARGSAKSATFDGEHVTLAGQDTGTRILSSVLSDSVDATQQGTPASTTETSLHSYTLPASTLAIDDRMLRIVAMFSTAANSNAKDIIVKFGSTEILKVVGLMNNSYAAVECYVLRTGATTQKVWGKAEWAGDSGTPTNTVKFDGTAAETLSSSVTIDFRGQSDGGAASDVVYQSSFVELMN